MRTLPAILALLLLALPAAADLSQTPDNPDAVAVIIGNGDYEAAGNGVPDVDYALRDAAAFKRFATEVLGIRKRNVIHLENAAKSDLERVFGTQLSYKGDLYFTIRPYVSEVVVFYSGHGVPHPTPGETRGFLLPVDGRADRPEIEGYPLDQMLENLGELPALKVTVFLDACFSGLTPAGSMIPGISGAFGLEVTIPVPKPTVTVLAATAYDEPQYANWLEEEEHGAFTWYTLRGLHGEADGGRTGNGDGQVTMGELHEWLIDEMSYRVRRGLRRIQTPSLTGAEDLVLTAAHGGDWPQLTPLPAGPTGDAVGGGEAGTDAAGADVTGPAVGDDNGIGAVTRDGPESGGGEVVATGPAIDGGESASPPPPPTPAETEQALGLNREARRNVQRWLNALGHKAGGVDGAFGPMTRAAIRRFEASVGVSGTGYLDTRRLARLERDGKPAWQQYLKDEERRKAEEKRKKEEERRLSARRWTSGPKGPGGNFIIYFGFDVTSFTSRGSTTITEVTRLCRANSRIAIVGHTDTAEGTQAVAQGLSERRARAVAVALTERGVPASIMLLAGRGKRETASPTGDKVREPINRRVEISCRP